MNSEKDFKDALKEKLNEKQFQFDESAWEQASQMLDATREEKKKRPFPYFLVSGILLFVSVIGFFVLKPTETVKEISSTNTITDASAIKKDERVNAETKEISPEKIIANPSPLEKNVNTGSKKEIVENKTVDIEKATSVKENSIATKKTNSQQKSREPKTRTKIITNPVIAIASKNEENNITATTNTKEPEEYKVVVNQTPVTKTKEVVKEHITVAEEIKADELVTLVSLLPVNTSPVKEPLAYIELPKTNEAPNNNVKEPVHFISFEAGANYLFGWNNPGKKDANGINPIVGLNYSNVNKPITFSFGIHYTMVRNLSYSSHTVTTTRYNFGEESDVMVFTPTTMHYLVAPIRIGYSIDPKNTFGLGYNVGYLLNLNSNVELYAQSAGRKSNSTVLKTSGYTQGFKTLDQQISVFYRRNLSKDLYLNTEFMFGLTDIKDNKFFNSASFERNMGLKITLMYNLFKK